MASQTEDSVGQVAETVVGESETVNTAVCATELSGNTKISSKIEYFEENEETKSVSEEEQEKREPEGKETSQDSEHPSSHSHSTNSESKNQHTVYVGNLPLTSDESFIKNIFTPFGDVLTVRLLKDKQTNQFRGVAFVEFNNSESVNNAVKSLGKVHIPPGCTEPITVNHVHGKANEASKLYVKPLRTGVTEEELRALFMPYGTILSIHIIRKEGSFSYGFIQYMSRHYAMRAVNALNGQRDKVSDYAVMTVEPAGMDKQKNMNRRNNLNQNRMQNRYPQYNLHNAIPIQPQFTDNGSGMMVNPAVLRHQMNNLDSTSHYQQQTYMMPQLYQQTSNLSSYMSTQYSMPNPPQPVTQKSRGPWKDGPEGANLYVSGLPLNFTDIDIRQLFEQFGNIVAYRVIVDSMTQNCKGYGFISFDNKISAAMAIKQMNGFQCGQKRLRVALREKSSKPYQ